jgi:hypothetical protein
MRYRTPSLACVGLALLLAACGGGEGGTNPNPPGPGPANTAPTANAGDNQTVTSGVTVTLDGLQSSDPDGTISAFAWTQTAGPTITLSSTSVARPTFVAPQVVAATTLTFSLTVTDNRGATSAVASTVSIIVGLPTGSVPLSGIVRFARVPFSASFPFGLNYASPAQQPARGVVIRARDAITQTLLASTITDNAGGYSFLVPANTNITLHVEARLQRASSPTWDIRVQDGTAADTPYTFTDAQINSSAGTRNVDIPTGINPDGTAAATKPRASGPFAILDSIYQGLQTIIAVAPNTNFPELIVDWGTQANGTFFQGDSPQHIALLADLTEDTDEFDQHVIAHEFGHYLEHNFSRADSIGGSHALGDRLDPRVAFGEGFGYAFAAIVLNDTNSRDSFNDNGTQRSGGFNIETNPGPANLGDQFGCWCSESSVWSILWDINDSAADANDNVALGFGPIWQVLTGPQRTTPSITSIFSFVSALKSAGTGQNAAIDTLVAAQNITSNSINAFATTETHSPANTLLPIFTDIVAGTPRTVFNTDDFGQYNKLGNHRFLRYVAASSGTRTITMTSTNSNNADPDFVIYHDGAQLLPAAPDNDDGEDGPPQPEMGRFNFTAGTTYVLDVYDCANGCSTIQGVAGDYDLTVTITP